MQFYLDHLRWILIVVVVAMAGGVLAATFKAMWGVVFHD